MAWIFFPSLAGLMAQGKADLIMASPPPEQATGWRGPARDGIFPENNLLTAWPEGGPELLWRYDSLGSGSAEHFSEPVIKN
jgi:hypothetical protein